MLRHMLALFVAVSLSSSSAQSLVGDINEAPAASHEGSSPRPFATFAGAGFFGAEDGIHGRELWTSDGTEAGTVLVADLYPGPTGSEPESFVVHDGQLYFRAIVPPGHDFWLWVSDGTEAGTHLVPDTAGVSGLTVAGDNLFYQLPTGAWFESELWVSDGTAEGATVLASPEIGNADFPRILGAALGLVFFEDAATGFLWRSDGTPEGTLRLGAPVLDTGSSHGFSLVELDGLAYFPASEPGTGKEIWSSDGTKEGTQLAVDLAPGPASADVRDLVSIGGALYFSACSGPGACDAAAPRVPWTSDGTSGGTLALVASTAIWSSLFRPAGVDQVVFRAVTATGADELWVTDGTPSGTQAIVPVDSNIDGITTLPSGVALVETDSDVLWRTDGTVPGTWAVVEAPGLKVWAPGPGFAWMSAELGDSGVELWTSDGTVAGTNAIEINGFPITEGSDPVELTGHRGTLLFSADDGVQGRELWRSDGTEAGTSAVLDLWPGSGSSSPRNLTSWNGLVYFGAEDPAHPNGGLWATDGTAQGTALVRNVFPAALVATDGALFFTETKFGFGTELWTSDGTWNGTGLVLDIWPGEENSYPQHLTPLGDLLVFEARTSEAGFEPWVSDGTAGGTHLLADLYPGPSPSSITGFFPVAGGAVFRAAPGAGLHFTDGTTEGTVPVDLGVSTIPSDFLSIGDTALFASSAGDLWRTDGTAAGTFPLLTGHELHLEDAVRAGDHAFFWLQGDDGWQLWTSDGTAEGTSLVHDLDPADLLQVGPDFEPNMGAVGSGPVIALEMTDGIHGREVWVASPDGAQMLDELVPGSGGADSARFVRAGETVFFSSGANGLGEELYAFPFSSAGSWVVEPYGAGCSGSGAAAELTLAGVPEPNAAVSLDVTGALPLAPAGILYALDDLGLPLGSSCEWLLGFPNWVLAADVTDGGGTLAVPITWPADVALVALPVFFQGIVEDASLALGLGLTNGLEVMGAP